MPAKVPTLAAHSMLEEKSRLAARHNQGLAYPQSLVSGDDNEFVCVNESKPGRFALGKAQTPAICLCLRIIVIHKDFMIDQSA